MSYWTNKLTEQSSLIGRPCWYQKPYNTDIVFGLIKDVSVKQTMKGKEAIATLDNGVVAVLHTYGCPDFIGKAVWGFLTRAECKEYWDM
jgi:hypothetical protein